MFIKAMKSIYKAIGVAESWLTGLLLFVMMLLVVYIVVARYVLKISTPGIDELALMMMIALIFVGSGAGTMEESHLKIDVRSLIFKSQKVLDITKFCSDVISMVVCFTFTYLSYEYMLWAIGSKLQTSGLAMSLAPSMSVLFVGGILMSFHLLVIVVRGAISFKKRPTGASMEGEA